MGQRRIVSSLPVCLPENSLPRRLRNRLANLRQRRIVDKLNLIAVASNPKIRPQLVQIHRYRRILPLRILFGEHMRSRRLVANRERLVERPLVIDRSSLRHNRPQRILQTFLLPV